MGHSIHNRYKMKLNKAAPYYDGLVDKIKTYLQECQLIDQNAKEPGESYGVSIKEFSGEMVVSFRSYKSPAPVKLSSDIISLLKDNINTDSARFYYYLEEGHEGFEIRGAYGKADIVASLYNTWRWGYLSEKDDLEHFQNTLYGDPTTSVDVNDTTSLIQLIKALEFKGREAAYLHKDVNRILIPIWRNPSNGCLVLAGQALVDNNLALYAMKVTRSGETKIHHIVESEDAGMSFDEFIARKQTEITKNLQLPELVAVAIKRESSRNSYTGVTFQHAHFRTNLNLFDEKGPFIEVKNKIV